MKKFLISYAVFTIACAAGCHPGDTRTTKKQSDSVLTKADNPKLISKTKYTCTMDPEVISDTPGHCPKCGMDLVPINDSTRK